MRVTQDVLFVFTRKINHVSDIKWHLSIIVARIHNSFSNPTNLVGDVQKNSEKVNTI